MNKRKKTSVVGHGMFWRDQLSRLDSLGRELSANSFCGLAIDGNPQPNFEVRQAPDLIAVIANFAAMLGEDLFHCFFSEQAAIERARLKQHMLQFV